jgi:hypothetical protein
LSLIRCVEIECGAVEQGVGGNHQSRRDFVGETAEIESVQAVCRTGCVVGIDHHVQGVAAEIDYGGGVDPDVSTIIPASQRTCDRSSEIRIEKHGAAFRIDRVDCVALGGHVNDVVQTFVTARGDIHGRNEEGLRIDLIVERDRVQHRKGCAAYIGRGQNSFVRVPASPIVVDVIGGDRLTGDDCGARKNEKNQCNEGARKGETDTKWKHGDVLVYRLCRDVWPDKQAPWGEADRAYAIRQGAYRDQGLMLRRGWC